MTEIVEHMGVVEPGVLQGLVQPLGLALTGLLLQAINPVATVLVLFIPQFILSIAVTFNQHVRHAKPISEMK